MILHLRACTVDLDRLRVERGDEVLSLTSTEVRLLRYLLSSGGEAVDQYRLLRDVWGYSPRVRSNTVRTTVSRLRAKIEADPTAPLHLVTVVGEGYRLVVPTGTVPDRAPLLGRSAEIEALLGLADAPLITVTGPAGVGKTRVVLALSAALRQSGHHVVGCDAGSAQTIAEFAEQVAEALAVTPTADPVDQLGHVLAGRPGLVLVLDEMEHLVDGAGGVLARWLALAPCARIVVASRAVLGLSAERVFPLPPLEPDAAAALFRRRAGEVRPGLEFDEQDEAVRAIVASADHLPLAIELAAGWVDIMDLPALAAQLADRLATLRDHRQEGRHASLEAALAQSWDLLDPELREALGEVSALAGPFDVTAAQAVVSGPDVLGALRALIDRSWVYREPSGRLSLLASVREFVRGRVPEAAARASDRHLAWLLHREEGIEPAEVPAAVAAVRHGLLRDPPAGAELLLRIDPVLKARGSQLLRLELLEAACARVPDGSDALWIRLQATRGSAGSMLRRVAPQPLEEAVERARALGRPDLLALALAALGEAHLWAAIGDARALLEEALGHARASGDPALELEILRRLTLETRIQGDLEACLACSVQARALAQRLGDDLALARVLIIEGNTHLLQGRLAPAARDLRRARALDGSPRTQAHVGLYLGSVHMLRGELDQAFPLLRDAAAFFRGHGEPRMEALAYGRYAEARLQAGDTDAALAYNARGIDAARRLESPHIASFEVFYAETHLARGDVELARTQARHAVEVFEANGEPRHAATAWMTLGRVEHVAGALPEAVRAYRAVLDRVAPGDVYALAASAWLAAALAEQGEAASARDAAPDLAVVEADEEVDRRTANALVTLLALDPAEARARLSTARGREPLGYQCRAAVAIVGRAVGDAGGTG